MRTRRARTDSWIGAVLAIVLFGAFPAFIIVGSQACADEKPGVFCAAVKFVLDDAPLATRVAKARLQQ